MKHSTVRWGILAVALCLALLLGSIAIPTVKYSVALIRIVDAAGSPVSGATIQPEGLRTKPGPYVSGWYGWDAERHGVPKDPVVTDADGYAAVPYPKYVFEKIETGAVHFSVHHPDFAPTRPERVVATAPPAGTPWRLWLNYLWHRVQQKVLIARPDPVVLERGAILRISVPPFASNSPATQLFAQVSGDGYLGADSWIWPEPGMVITRRLLAGPRTVRAVQFDAGGAAWFSDVASITAVVGQTNDLVLTLKRGVNVRGHLDATVPRPVKNGRVVAHVWPRGHQPKDSPPQWHTWNTIQEDGSFEIHSLPEGDLEIVALCQGFVSTNGPGQSRMRYPQKHSLETNDVSIVVGMEPTVRLEVKVTDPQGNPLKGVAVGTWPNVRYGEWSATILTSDCYRTADFLMAKAGVALSAERLVEDFHGVSDDSGVAVIPNLPVDVIEIMAVHPRFALPAIPAANGEKQRLVNLKLISGQTNRVSVRLEPLEKSPVAHY